MNPNEIYHQAEKKVCPECGEHYEEHIESYLNECDHCLSKKAE